MAIEIKRAVRQRIWLKIAITGGSGSGKTWGGIDLAKGLATDPEKILVLDTENESACSYAGTTDNPGEWIFDHLPMHPPFTTAKYISAIKEAVRLGYEVLVIDSISHEWDAQGGILDQKSDLDARNGEKWGNWKAPKAAHNDFKEEVLQSPIHIIATMRSKQEYVLEKDDRGKQVPKKLGMAPIQEKDSDYEFFIVFDVDRDSHIAIASKDRTNLFDQQSFKLSREIGAKIRTWRESGVPLTPQEPHTTTATATATNGTATPAATVAKAPEQSPAPAAGAPQAQGASAPTNPRPTPAAPASPATTGSSKPNSAAAPAQTAPSKPGASAINPPAEAQRWPNALIELNAAMFKAGWSNDARMATAEEWKAKGPAALPELIALLNAGLPAQAPADNPEWIAAMDELLQVSMGMPAATRKALVASFEADGPAALPILRVEIQKIRTADAAPTTPGAVLAQLPRTVGPEVDQASATFVDSVQPDTDEANGGISADEYEILNTILKAHGINRDAMRAYAAGSHKLLPGAGGRPTLARFKKTEFDKLLVRLRDTKIAAEGETWSARTIRIINATPTTAYAPVASAS